MAFSPSSTNTTTDPEAIYAVKSLNEALKGAVGTTAVHMCFGYAHAVKNKPNGYSFLSELSNCDADQISIEAAQPQINLGVLSSLKDKNIILGVLDLGSEKIETPEIVAGRIRDALKYVRPDRAIIAPDCGMKYLSRELAFKKLESMVHGANIVRAELEG